MSFLSKNVKITVVQNMLVTGSSVAAPGQESDTIDMSGFDGALFISTVGATSDRAVLTIQAATSTTAADFATITGASGGSTASNGVLAIDVLNPTKRYLRSCLESSTKNVSGGTMCIQYRAHSAPTSNSTTEVLSHITVIST